MKVTADGLHLKVESLFEGDGQDHSSSSVPDRLGNL